MAIIISLEYCVHASDEGVLLLTMVILGNLGNDDPAEACEEDDVDKDDDDSDCSYSVVRVKQQANVVEVHVGRHVYRVVLGNFLFDPR